ncbi:MAG: hypothetical protein LBD30_01895 [Verrucomicrobiales bacterium]|jgi:hypothetical protein|nr:hypothetical protein [Verrucomicrobiales bacterium]
MQTDYRKLYEMWTPEDSPWSPWVKPALFAGGEKFHDPGPPADAQNFTRDDTLPAVPPAWSAPQNALVVDLPADAAMAAAAQLARAGYRPLLLMNTSYGAREVVDTRGVLRALKPVAEWMERANLSPSAPPAFLLDAHRNKDGGLAVKPGDYDNRWLVFPQDFPSAEFLQDRGVGKILLYHAGRRVPADDLAHVMLRWQEAGLSVSVLNVAKEQSPQPLTVSAPPSYRSWLYRLLVMLKLRRNSAGGFGATVPMPSSGHG